MLHILQSHNENEWAENTWLAKAFYPKHVYYDTLLLKRNENKPYGVGL